MRLAAHDEATVQAVIVLLAVVLMTFAVGGTEVLVHGADERGIEAEAEATPSVDETILTLEREAQRLRQSVAALTKELKRPEVKWRLGIEGSQARPPVSGSDGASSGLSR